MKPEEYNIPKEKFALVNENKKLHDKELVTKPVGFFKDAMHRFARNKGSIFGASVIGLLALYAIIVPIVSQYKVSYNDAYYVRTLPKLFNIEGFDFLDGAENVESNISTFLNHYSMGLETGHNAVKRQSYSYNENTEKFSYRLDSYQSIGTVYMTGISEDDYKAIQDYQDRTNTQVIYPITNPDKRPQAKVNISNANFWYETEFVEGNDVPINYTKNADGSYTLPNIYVGFETPTLNASSTNKGFVTLEEKDGGFAIKLYSNKTEEKFEGYIKCGVEEGEINYTTITDEFSEATSFRYDNIHYTFVTTLNGHDDAALDGDYFFALPTASGSTAALLKIDNIGSEDYSAFHLYSNNTIVETPNTTDRYTYAVNRQKTTGTTYFAGSYVPAENKFIASTTKSGSVPFSVISSGTGYKLRIKIDKFNYYLNPKVNGNETLFGSTTNANDAAIWQFDATTGGFKINVTGHTSPSYDGEYFIGLNMSTTNGKDSSTIVFLKANQVDDTNKILAAINANGEAVTTFDSATPYYLSFNNVVYTDDFYMMNGSFKGDNYFSKMRIEGEDEFLYSYALQKDGNTYEIRVNYYEYYCYYHKEIVKDRITSPYFIFGTTSKGQDIFTCLASGARFSFILAISVASVNFLVGTLYGAVEGYYGGKIDMIMERIVEILSAVPFMIVITLLKYHMTNSSHVLILFISFFLTGWIGMSGTVRMQFYRFKNQEYVLASRTLGAKDPRIMFKHIFPNSLGTIITSSVLVIPGMIFSETSLSYLGIINLNSGDMTSVGTLLAEGQPFLVTFPHIILFPAIYISLLMLCFNLFGNGLRDAFNPSLRGTEE